MGHHSSARSPARSRPKIRSCGLRELVVLQTREYHLEIIFAISSLPPSILMFRKYGIEKRCFAFSFRAGAHMVM